METHLSPEFASTPEGQQAEAILRNCVHCGFCTATCPTYQLLGDELDGPRGRIYQIKQVLEGEAPTRNFFVISEDDGHIVPVDLRGAQMPVGGVNALLRQRVRVTAAAQAKDAQALSRTEKFVVQRIERLPGVTAAQPDVFPMADGFKENVEFFTLAYEAPMRVQSNREFERIAPFLWLRAGSRGRRIESLDSGWDVAEAYGVLADLDQTDSFIEAMCAAEDAKVAFIVTDEDRLFEAVVRDLPEGVEPVRMYEAYLRNFEIDAMRSVR